MKNENVNLIRLRCIENVLFSDIVISHNGRIQLSGVPRVLKKGKGI